MLTFSAAQLSAWYGALFWPLVRVLALFSAAPIFSHPSLPLRVRIGLAIAISLVLAPGVPLPSIDDVLSAAGLLALARNIMIGLVLGFTVRLVFAAIEMAGELIGLQIGFSFAGLINPASNQPMTPISTFLTLLATLMFLAIDGHLMLLHALAESFQLFPIVGSSDLPMTPEQVAHLGAQMFALALSIALPLITVMLTINVLMGVLARVAPQMNLFAVGFPLTLTTGMGALFVLLPYLEGPLRAALERGAAFWVH
jgi:flagellar biosynthetic protein FliR